MSTILRCRSAADGSICVPRAGNNLVSIFQHLVQEPPTCLIRDGKLLWQNLRREMISLEELKTQLRQQDITDLSQVFEAYLETDGAISALTFKQHGATGSIPTAPQE